MRKVVCFILLLTGSCVLVTAQQHKEKVMLSDTLLSYTPLLLPPAQKAFSSYHFDPYHSLTSNRKQPAGKIVVAVAQPSPDFYYTHCYGFFCKMEWLTQKELHIPLSFRLGTYHYERRLEGKE